MSEYLQAIFPGLRETSFRITSPVDNHYNCMAWAAHDEHSWWWPHGDSPSVTWPPTAVRELSISAFASAFSALGYVADAGDDSLEPGVEKIAIFADAAGKPTHASRQLPSGRWTSKLGRSEDIEHELRSLEGEIYGTVALILKRLAR